MRRAVIGSALALIAAGCGGEPASEPSNTRQPDRPAAQTGAAKFRGLARNTYDDSKQLCGGFPPEEVARDYGIRVDTSTSEGIVRIAKKHAEGYRGDVHQAAFEGCMAGLPDPR